MKLPNMSREVAPALVIAPLHGRGDPKAASGSKILSYRKPANVRDEWPTEVLGDSLHATHNFDLFQIFVIVASQEGVWRLPHHPDFPNPIFGADKPAGEVRLALHRTPFLATIEPMHGNQLAVYVKEKRHLLTDQMNEGHALAVGDIAGDRTPEIAVGWRGKDGGVRVFTSTDETLSTWRESVIDDGGMACEDLCLADLDGDRDLEIIASGRATKNVKIYWNETPAFASTRPANPP
jgi:hypothetical protein